jgi:hypothetical protein
MSDETFNKVNIMSKYSKQEKARILAEARRHLAGRRAEALQKQQLPLEKRKMTEPQSAREPLRGPRICAASEFDRDMLIDLVAAVLGIVLRRQS